MYSFETTTLWCTSLSPRPETDSAKYQRDELREAFYSFRNRAKVLAAEIPRSMPNLTVHDIAHIDALWETASLIAGPDFILTPTEAFVLGGAFLVHDLAMSLAAYPQSSDSLLDNVVSRDMIASVLTKTLNRPPSRGEIENPDEEILEQATRELLRINHAQQAERLPTIHWKAPDRDIRYYLIESPELRETYGPTIGRIAHSHWWPVSKLAEEFGQTLGALGGFSPEWELDPLKVAILLRLADASQLDDRRAPSFLRALRDPKGISAEHWRFQNNLFQPRREFDRLIYTAKRPFTIDEAPAWWMCFDSLQMVDEALRQVDALMTPLKKPRLAARGVAKVESPERLMEVVRTEGWIPVDTRIRVTDVAALARKIGGEQLYGDDISIPLRELIQNASDAVRARRLMQNREDDWGEIYVRIGNDGNENWLEVEDSGLGMSRDVLKGPFLDFGSSYWGSELMIKELPGLLSRGFQSTGEYGIGFFSVFMWGDRVQVTTRWYEDALMETYVLAFSGGLTSRPILRKATKAEQLVEAGTRVKVWLRDASSNKRKASSLRRLTHIKSLYTLCGGLCPGIDVNLHVAGDNQQLRVISASDWITLSGQDLVDRVRFREPSITERRFETAGDRALEHMTLLRNSSGDLVGRAQIAPLSFEDRTTNGIVTIGGFRASELSHISGILVGLPMRVARDLAIPLVEEKELARWASEQAESISHIHEDPEYLMKCSEIIRSLGGTTGSLPIAIGSDGWVNFDEVSEKFRSANQIFIISDFAVLRKKRRQKRFELSPWVLALKTSSLSPHIATLRNIGINWPELESVIDPWGNGINLSPLELAAIEALSKGWGVTVEDVLRVSTFNQRDKHVVGTHTQGDKPFHSEADVIKNPRALRNRPS